MWAEPFLAASTCCKKMWLVGARGANHTQWKVKKVRKWKCKMWFLGWGNLPLTNLRWEEWENVKATNLNPECVGHKTNINANGKDNKVNVKQAKRWKRLKSESDWLPTILTGKCGCYILFFIVSLNPIYCIDGQHCCNSMRSGQEKFLEAAKVWKFTATTLKYQKRSERVQLDGSQDECSSCQKQSIKVAVERNWCNCKGILISWKILAVGASLPSSCLKFDPIWARARLQSSTGRHSSSVSEKEEK